MEMPPLVRIGFPLGVKASFDPSMVEPNAVYEARNVRSDESGILRLRKGVIAYNVPMGVGWIQDAKSAFGKILAVWNRKLYHVPATGEPEQIGTETIGATNESLVTTIRWARNGAEIAYLFAGNGIYETNGSTTFQKVTPYTPISGEPVNLLRKSDGTQELDSGPARCTFGVLRASLSQRLALSGDPKSPNTVYFSGPLDATYYASNQILQLPDDGSKIVALENWYNALVIFRDRDIWAFFGSDLTDESAALVLQDGSVGCIARKSVVPVPEVGIAFLGADNVYALQGVSGIENQQKAVPVGDDIRKPLLRALKQGLAGVSAIYFDREYRLSIPRALEEDRVFRLSLQHTTAWYIDSGPRTAHFFTHEGELYGTDLAFGTIYHFTDVLTDDERAISAYIAFRREDLQPGPSRIKRLFVYSLAKGRQQDGDLFFVGPALNTLTLNEPSITPVSVQTGTEQHLKVSLVIDGVEVSLNEINVTIGKVSNFTLAKLEPVRMYEAKFRPSIKGHFVQVRINTTRANEDIAILGYGLEYSAKYHMKGIPNRST